jgi:GTP1/Obg family GTP-binding protein
MRMHESTPSHDPFSAQLHPYDHNLVEYLLPGGAKKDYTTLLNHCRNLVQKLRGAAAKGLAGLNHSKNMSESRTAHVTAIRRMKELWVSGDPQGQMEVDGGSGQRSGMQLVEELRLLSRTLRHIPTIEFERNLLDVKRHAASYLSVLPQEFFFALPSQELTFERLRPYLPPSPTYTFSLVGAPNVGKSSLLAALSAAKVEVRDFAFTTRSVQVGHLQREELESPSFNTPEALAASATKRKPRKSPYPLPRYTPAVPLTRVQLVDTPGLLFRPDAMRKPVEKLTLSLCENIQPLLLAFVLDPTGQSGSGVRTQAMLLREMHRRFALHRAPHPLADDTDPRNHLAHDPLYANVAADAELQSLTRRLQAIPWMVLRSKADVGKREHVKDEVLARSTNAAEREVRAVEEELMQHNDAAIHEEEDNEAEAEEGEEEKQDVDASSVESSSTALEAASVEQQAKKAKMTRAEWKMASIRAHMHKYLCDSEGRLLFSSLDALVDEELPRPHSKVADMLQLTSSSDADALAITQRASHRQQQQQQQQQAQHGSAGSLSSLPCLRVSVESGQGISELVEHIWWEVDRRESLRLERAYKEMRKRILWIRGETEEGRASAHQQQQLSSSTPRDHLLQSSTQQQQHVHSDPVDAKLAPPSEF